jgi:glycosyltransferase involved in cell wall biosynthesis
MRPQRPEGCNLREAGNARAVRPTVVRGVPLYEAMPFNPTGSVIRVLYHGLLVPSRGLEQAIASVKLWRSEFLLVIRGIGESDYIALLRSLAEREGVADRIRFEPSVPFTGLVAAANACDVG